MPKTRWILLVLVCCLLVPVRTAAQETAKESRRAAADTDRLFLGFGQEATLVDRQWWEGRLEYFDLDGGADITVLRAVAAFQPWDDVEFGGNVGFGDSSGFPGSGSGATDLDLWAKFHFGEGGDTQYAAGALFVVPTGDDTAGLGYDAFSFGGFASLRHRGERATFHGNLAVRGNGEGIGGVDGKTSVEVGIGAIIPANDRLSFVGEARFESERFDGFDSDLRVLGGINLRAGDRGAFRAALAVGLTDGAPDLQILGGYAASF